MKKKKKKKEEGWPGEGWSRLPPRTAFCQTIREEMHTISKTSSNGKKQMDLLGWPSLIRSAVSQYWVLFVFYWIALPRHVQFYTQVKTGYNGKSDLWRDSRIIWRVRSSMCPSAHSWQFTMEENFPSCWSLEPLRSKEQHPNMERIFDTGDCFILLLVSFLGLP